MGQTSEECLAFLGKAREALKELTALEEQERQLELEERRNSKALELEQKTVTDTIQQTVKKRREEINVSYDKEITRAQDQLKKARTKREKAKNQGVKERIADETSELHNYNRELRLQMKTSFRQNHVPGYCNTSLYYSLYFARWMKEFLTFLLFVAIVFAAIPWGIYMMIPERQPWYLAVIYVVDILVFGGIYLKIGNVTKVRHMETLKEGRKILDQIHSNDRKIRVITSTIRKDRNESLYNLEKYDDEIAQFQQELNDVAAKKKEALNAFETVTKNILQDEIEHNHKEALDTLQAGYAQVKDQLRVTSAEVKNRRLDITDHYGTYLGKEFLDPAKIAELCTIVQEGKAANVSEAIDAYRSRKSSEA
ncbi:MAG: hypothetical protein Q4F28_15545 [Eubacteriales bacterium]|nr:hypothetical protein [Eubacteriales bacterium]